MNIGGNTIIETGLQPGEIIVTDGIQKLRDGAVVQLSDTAASH
jgi:multidrug efflux system membrane fusion protein